MTVSNLYFEIVKVYNLNVKKELKYLHLGFSNKNGGQLKIDKGDATWIK